jgi:hypothetical protein
MTKALFLILAFSFTVQAQAQELTPTEFAKIFVAQVNAQIKIANAALMEEYKGQEVEYPRFYCKQLNKNQIASINQAASVPLITVGEFREQVLGDLKCFQERWPGLSKTNIWDTILNSGALVKDSYLLHDSLNALSPNGYARDTETLLFLVTGQVF